MKCTYANNDLRHKAKTKTSKKILFEARPIRTPQAKPRPRKMYYSRPIPYMDYE